MACCARVAPLATCPMLATVREHLSKELHFEISEGGLDLPFGIHCLHVRCRNGIAELARRLADAVRIWRSIMDRVVAFTPDRACKLAGQCRVAHQDLARLWYRETNAIPSFARARCGFEFRFL